MHSGPCYRPDQKPICPARVIGSRKRDRRKAVPSSGVHSSVAGAMKPADNRVGAVSRQATKGVRRCPTTQCCPEDHGFDAVIVKRAHRRLPPTCRSVRAVANLRSGNKPCVQQSRSAYSDRRKAFALPERGLWTCFPEQRNDRARREFPTGRSSLTQKTRCTTACCWAMETSTTGVKAMKGLTRLCADLVESKRP
jgi:hypothetical protein